MINSAFDVKWQNGVTMRRLKLTHRPSAERDTISTSPYLQGDFSIMRSWVITNQASAKSWFISIHSAHIRCDPLPHGNPQSITKLIHQMKYKLYSFFKQKVPSTPLRQINLLGFLNLFIWWNDLISHSWTTYHPLNLPDYPLCSTEGDKQWILPGFSQIQFRQVRLATCLSC